MKTTLLTAIMGVTIGTLSSFNASAQVPTRLVMTVPFDFQIHERSLPAGEYILRAENRILYVTSVSEPRNSQMVMAISGQNRGDLPARAVFHRAGDRYYLSQVYAGPHQSAWELPPSSGVEREALRPETMAKVVLKLRYSYGTPQ
jgi:hypothetical protein